MQHSTTTRHRHTLHKLVVAGVVLISMSFSSGRQQALADEVTAPAAPANLRLKGTPSGPFANLEAIGLNPNEFWVPQPVISQITFRPPAQNDAQGLRIGRLWLPSTIAELRATINRRYLGVNDDGTPFPGAHAANISNSGTGAHSKALVALVTNNSSLMAEARADLLADNPGRMAGMTGLMGDLWAAIYALDWITWTSEAEFEQAFALVKAKLDLAAAGSVDWGGPNRGGYYDNDNYFSEYAHLEPQLVAVAHGRPGPSGVWAADRLAHINDHPDDPGAMFSPYRAANTLSVISQNGGGQQIGTGGIQSAVAFGGYEFYFGVGGGVLLRAWDTATGSNLLGTELYHRTRGTGFARELDTVVEHRSAVNPHGSLVMEMASGLLNDPAASWVLDNSPNWDGLGALQYFIEYRALCGQRVAAAQPSLVGTASHQWHYQDGQVQLRITTPHIQHTRRDPDSRTFGYRNGSVGLVQGHYNRGSVTGTRANGIHIQPASDSVDLVNGATYQFHPFFSNLAVQVPEPVASDPAYLMTTIRPQLVGGKYQWTEDWTYRYQSESGLKGKVQLARTTYSYDTATRVLTIEDEIEADADLYIGWHFSPSHMPTINGTQIDFANAGDALRVKVEAIDGVTTFTSASIDTENTDLHTQFLDRIAANVSFQIQTRLPRHHVRVTILPH